jgi:dolichol-phosphate mannosyltransferase
MEFAMDTPELSIVIPVYDESGNILPLVEEVRSVLDRRLRYEIIFVNDGSTDGTGREIETQVAAHEVVRSVHHPVNRGQSAAVRTGVEAARSTTIAVMDGDGQNDPKDILRLYGQLRAVRCLRMVIGERQRRQDGWLRRLSSRVANVARSRLLGDGFRDTGCGIKVFYRNDYLGLPAFNHMHRFLPALMQRNGRAVWSIPVNYRPRRCGRSKYGVNNRLWVGIADLFGVMWLQKRRL